MWIYVYQYLELPEHYDITALFERQSTEEQERLRQALSGTLAVGLTGGLGEQYQAFLNSLEDWKTEAGGGAL